MSNIPLLNISVWLIAKIFVLVGFAIYNVFAIVIVRQVKLMTETVDVELNGFVKLLSYAHLAFAILVFILALVIL